MDVPPNETPEAVKTLFDQVTGVLSAYGWTILFFVVVLNLIWSHFYPKYVRWRERQEEEQIEAEYKKDPSLIIARDEAMMLARQRMQEEHDRVSKERADQIREREEKKRKEKLEAMESLIHGKPKPSSSKNNSSPLRPEFNPLMGSGGGSCGYRPSRRGGPSGGG